MADEEARLAADEAGHIGGRPTDDPPLEEEDEAYRAVDEAGGGESEGFELAEEELIENAANLGPARPDSEVRVREETDDEEFDPDLADYGEADSEHREDL